MTSLDELTKRPWWGYLEEDLQELLKQAFLLVEKVGSWDQKFHDYSFVVFPASKAYEGFLKKLFLDMGFINRDDYYGRHFRIGRSLNPSLEPRLRQIEGVYDKIVSYCGGKEFADKLWETWKVCRNLVFHWFPDEKRSITYEEASDRVQKIVDTIDAAVKECKIEKDASTQVH